MQNITHLKFNVLKIFFIVILFFATFKINAQSSEVTTSWSNNILTITVPNGVGEFDYKIEVEGNCDVTTGKIIPTPKPADIVTTQTICEGESYIWPANNTNYTTAQNGLRISNDGCTADQVLNLTVNEEVVITQIAFVTCTEKVYNNMIVNEVTKGEVTGIGTPAGLPSGLSLVWSASDNTIRLNGSATELGSFWYSVPLISQGCGTQTAIGQIVVNEKPEDIITNKTICEGETYTWPANGATYSTSKIRLRTKNLCEADEVLNLTVIPKPDKITTYKTICAGETYTWIENGITYNTPGTYTKTNDGCTADQELILNVNAKPADIFTYETICQGETYIWAANNTSYTTEQNGLMISNDGCTADEVLFLTVMPKPDDIVTNKTICAGESYLWTANSTRYTTTQNGLRISNDGCTADQVLNLTVTPKPADVVTTASICPGDKFIWPANGVEYSTAQSGVRIKNNGCVADQVLILTVKEKLIITQSAFGTCIGEVFIDKTISTVTSGIVTGIGTPVGLPSGLSLIWSASDNTIKLNGSPTELGNFWFTVPLITENCGKQEASGNIGVYPKPQDIVTNKTICSEKTYTWPANGITYSTSQNGLKIVNDACTADQVLNLTVTPKPAKITTSKTICAGQTYTWIENGVTYSTAGTYSKTNSGCIADQELVLTVTAKPADVVTNKTICAGESYLWTANNTSYTTAQSGLRISNDGCTADQVLNLTVTAKPTKITTSKTICTGQTYTWIENGITYSTAGTYSKTNDGCIADQELILTVTAKPADVVTNKTICAGESYIWIANNTSYTTTQNGLKIVNDGCTADQVLNLTVTSKPAKITTSKTICAGQTYTWIENGITYSTAGTYSKTNSGCIADQELVLTVTPKPADVVTDKTICSGTAYKWSIDGKIYTDSGTFKKINDECTADQVLKLTVTSKPAKITTYKTICAEQTYTWIENGITYSTGGTYSKTNDGCTADQELVLTLTPKPADVITNKIICAGESYLWTANGTSYTTAQNGLRISNDGCTADQVLNLTVTSKPAKITTSKTICAGQTYTWIENGVTYSTAGTYSKTNSGCIADQELVLTVTAKPADVVTNKTICAGESYLWTANNTSYTTAQNGLRISNNGCTADQILNLTVKPKPNDIITNATMCSGQTYTWAVNNTTYSTAQNGLRISNDRCTADQVLNLTIPSIKPADVITDVTISEIESYIWPANGQTYKTTQKGLKIINNQCGADQVLNLTVLPIAELQGIDICADQTYTWPTNNVTYGPGDTGTYKVIKDGKYHYLFFTYHPPMPDLVTNETICEGQTYRWSVNNKTYTTTQTVRFKFDECGADRVLNLTVTPKPADIITNATQCEGYGYYWAPGNKSYTTPQTGLRIKSSGCSADQVLNLTFTPKPADKITNISICSGESYTWPANNVTYKTAQNGLRVKNDKCTADEILNLTITPKPADIITNATISMGQSYTWSANNVTYTTAQKGLKITNDGCTANQILNLTVTAKPADIVTNAVICAGGNYTWSANNTSYTIPQTGLKIPGNGNTADQILNLVVTSPLSAAILPESLLPEICKGDKNAEFTISISGGSLPYSVSLDNTNFVTISGNNHNFQKLSGGIYTVFIKDNLNCTTNLVVQIPNSISINPIAVVQYNCVDNLPSNSVNVNISPSITNSAEIDYSLDGNSTSYQSSPIFTNITPGKHFIRARHTNTCEQDTNEFTIEAFEPLSLTLSNTELNEISAIATGGNGAYKYSFEDESFTAENKFTVSKTGNYTVSVTDKNGCTASKTIFINYIDICIPTHFTPNGDGINDFWGPGCNNSFKNLNYSIFDRYGRKIGSYGVNDKWDGKLEGKELPSGDYWYVLKLNDTDNDREFIGHFTLYR